MLDNYVNIVKKLLSKHIDVEDDLLDLYALLVLTTGVNTTWENVHDAWAIWRNKTNPDHKSLIPFENLTPEVQQLDDEYTEAIKAVAKEIEEKTND
jgi:hypothetical protein